MASMRASHNASMAAATMATAVAPAAMANTADGLPDSLTELQKHTHIVRERRRLRRQQRWRAIRIQVRPPGSGAGALPRMLMWRASSRTLQQDALKMS